MKEVIYSFTVLDQYEPVEKTSITYCLYNDNTYRSSNFPQHVFSEWKIHDKRVFYRHTDMTEYGTWGGVSERWILDMLDVDAIIEQFLEEEL